jgi:hypothetical protein
MLVSGFSARLLRSRFVRMSACLSLVVVFLYADCPAAQETEDIPHISDIRLLRKLGQHEDALRYVKALLSDDSAPEQDRREAYCELITILYLTEGKERAESAAHDALTEFPDIKTNPSDHPSVVRNIIEDLRSAMFGLLRIESDPPACVVFLNGNNIGITPLDSIYVPAGDHSLLLSSYGYEDATMDVSIEPGRLTERFIELEKPSNIFLKGIGVEFGPSLVSISYGSTDVGTFAGIGEVYDYKSVPRFGGGLFAHLYLTEKFASQIGLRYSAAGNRASYATISEYPTSKYDLHLHYIGLSALLRLYPFASPGIYAGAGVELSYLIKAELSDHFGTATIDLVDELERRQVSLTLGAGYERGLANMSLTFSVYHTMGMMSLRKTSRVNEIDFKPSEWRAVAGIIKPFKLN